MSVIFPAGTSNRLAFSQIPALNKKAEFDFEEEVKEDVPEAIQKKNPEEVPVDAEEAIVSDISDVEEPNPAFDAIRSLPGFESDVAEIDALESDALESEGGEVAAGDVGAAAAKIEDAALQIADAAAQLAGAPAADACPCDKPADEAFVEISIDDDPGALEVVEVPESLEEPSTEKKEDKPADEEKKDEEKKDEPAEADKVEKEGCGSTAAVEQGTEKTASIKQGVPSRDFVEVAKLSPENKTFLRTYWKDILGFPPEYVDAMTKDYEK